MAVADAVQATFAHTHTHTRDQGVCYNGLARAFAAGVGVASHPLRKDNAARSEVSPGMSPN
eukprot:3518206-Prorocentrum_lima.AAC.1